MLDVPEMYSRYLLGDGKNLSKYRNSTFYLDFINQYFWDSMIVMARDEKLNKYIISVTNYSYASFPLETIRPRMSAVSVDWPHHNTVHIILFDRYRLERFILTSSIKWSDCSVNLTEFAYHISVTQTMMMGAIVVLTSDALTDNRFVRNPYIQSFRVLIIKLCSWVTELFQE